MKVKILATISQVVELTGEIKNLEELHADIKNLDDVWGNYSVEIVKEKITPHKVYLEKNDKWTTVEV